MMQSACKIMWLHQLLAEVGIKTSVPAKLWCGNQAALHIASNPVFHERIKHIKIDCHFIRDKNTTWFDFYKIGEDWKTIR